VNTFEEAEALLRQYNVKVCVMDALPETRKARELQNKFARLQFWLSYYTETGEATKKEALGVWDPRELKVNADRTRSLDLTFSQFVDAASGKPGRTLPANITSVRDYAAHLKASKRILKENAQGEKTAVYIESGPDHFAHAENYCTIARSCPYMQGWARGAA